MTNVKSVSVTDNSVLVLTNDGFVYGFGEMFVYNSRKIAQIPNLTGVAQISGMYARTTGGMVWRIDESGSPQKVSIKKNNSDVIGC